MTAETPTAPRPVNPWVKLALEMGPLVLFFLVNQQRGLITATAVFMVAVLVSLVATWVLTRHLPVMPLVSAVVVTVFGGLTVWLDDDLFIKLKPTIVNSLFGLVLLGGLAFGRPLLALVLDSVFRLTDEGWRKLTFRWALFFLFLAGLNEVVRLWWPEIWVSFKVFGIMPITLVFALAQTPLLQRYGIEDEEV